MFYRSKFDGTVGTILKRCGYDTSASLSFWPVGATPEYVKRGKSKGWTAIEAACLGVSQIALERCEAGQISHAEGQQIATTAHQVAIEKKARGAVLDHLMMVAFRAIPDLSKSG